MEWEQMKLISEMNQGKELANQLRNHLHPSSSSNQTREFLVEKILSTYEKALSILKWESNMVESKPIVSSITDSPCSFSNGSPRSEVSDQDCKPKDVYKKRKTLPCWTEQVKVCSGTGLEGPLDDGYNWRKYGQKDILGANFPRGYYRCTHRNTQGCVATKQVQRSDKDPTIFEVTYRGRHTCTQVSHFDMATPSKTKEEVKETPSQGQQIQPQAKGTFMNFGEGLKIKTHDLGSKEDNIFQSFCFGSPSIGSEIEENSIFTEPMMENNIFTDPMMENIFMESFSPTFISPATSESNFFSLSPCHVNNFGLNVQTSESDITEIISATTSVTNSPIGDFDFSLDKVDFDTNFPFDNPEFFS
ncbi:WRKY transcription factor [Quillaja saponaria]|uniref:WRKY transcription factor n=1 Tax=Quillaja saponaria TaxID=32244 RepID=A0AAD7LR15_QUISA|nr:WRKY transcription factor [Quillaja saponaria]